MIQFINLIGLVCIPVLYHVTAWGSVSPAGGNWAYHESGDGENGAAIVRGPDVHVALLLDLSQVLPVGLWQFHVLIKNKCINAI